ncbi:hypothetical protein B0H63DRAFT_258632 [Podospora didyma]|uniref:Uncharacterized protein n=1 Tax=Podospora didyma TaxID=330526 RepID=A0AAE0KEU8_9PEZI|nr:hypothetical protein B0H63DRAFT_258632 [Podospora didyma]
MGDQRSRGQPSRPVGRQCSFAPTQQEPASRRIRKIPIIQRKEEKDQKASASQHGNPSSRAAKKGTHFTILESVRHPPYPGRHSRLESYFVSCQLVFVFPTVRFPLCFRSAMRGAISHTSCSPQQSLSQHMLCFLCCMIYVQTPPCPAPYLTHHRHHHQDHLQVRRLLVSLFFRQKRERRILLHVLCTIPSHLTPTQLPKLGLYGGWYIEPLFSQPSLAKSDPGFRFLKHGYGQLFPYPFSHFPSSHHRTILLMPTLPKGPELACLG